MLPDIGLGAPRALVGRSLASFERASVSVTWLVELAVDADQLDDRRADQDAVAFLEAAFRIFSPLTKVPLVEPRSWIVTTCVVGA